MVAPANPLRGLSGDAGYIDSHNADVSNLQAQIASLSAELMQSKAEGDRQGEYLASDRDVRELMGARQLYIADVFDVDPHGVTHSRLWTAKIVIG